MRAKKTLSKSPILLNHVGKRGAAEFIAPSACWRVRGSRAKRYLSSCAHMHVYTLPCLGSWKLQDQETVPGLSNSSVVFFIWKHAMEVLLQISKVYYSRLRGELRNPSKSRLHSEPSVPPWYPHCLKAELIDITFGVVGERLPWNRGLWWLCGNCVV